MSNDGTNPIGEGERNRIQDTTAYKSILSLNIYDFVMHTFDGSHGYRDGSYLIPHPREVFYNTRRENSYFKNFYRPIIRAMVDPVFNGEINRETTDDAFNQFIENADNAGTSLANINRSIQYKGRIAGIAFLVMDNLPAEDQPATMGEAIQARAFPYVYIKAVQDMYEYNVNRFGALQNITFYDGKDAQDNTLIREWNDQEWIQYQLSGTGKDAKKIIVNRGIHGLGVVPVYPLLDYAESHSLEKLPDPPLYEIARLNFAIFNLEAEIRIMEQTQAFSVFYAQGLNSDSINLGVHNFINLPEGASIAPGYASPDGQHIVNLGNNATKLRDDLYMIAQRNGVIGIKEASSGVAKEWDFRAEEAVLKNTAMAAKNLELWCADMFGRYTKSTIQYEPEFPEQFSPTYTQDRINLILNTLDKLPPKEVATPLWQELVDMVWKNSPERAEEVKESMEEAEISKEEEDIMRFANAEEQAAMKGEAAGA